MKEMEPVKPIEPKPTEQLIKKVSYYTDEKGRISLTDPYAEGTTQVRHHTSKAGLSAIKKTGEIWSSRGKPAGVDIEVSPFLEPSNVNLGQAAGGVKGGGGYVEFTVPSNQIGPIPGYMGGVGNEGRIYTGGPPLKIQNMNAKYVNNCWWCFWE